MVVVGGGGRRWPPPVRAGGSGGDADFGSDEAVPGEDGQNSDGCNHPDGFDAGHVLFSVWRLALRLNRPPVRARKRSCRLLDGIMPERPPPP